MIGLRENTVAEIGHFRVGLSHIWKESWTTQTGEPLQAVRGTLSILSDLPEENHDFRVAAGDVVRIGDLEYRVVDIQEGDVLGSATLEMVREI
ncbi:MAG TPA: hypothetical protein ENJ57_06000 [Rhizobiales bacterium]|nr:hypothetical protein [Hyphomicrobiales bacterium]